MVLSSVSEGGANVDFRGRRRAGVPVLASRMDGNVGLLGSDYPGYFPVGDTRKRLRDCSTDWSASRPLRGFSQRPLPAAHRSSARMRDSGVAASACREVADP